MEKAKFFKLSTRNVHRKQNQTHGVVVMETLLAPVSFCQKPNILIFTTILQNAKQEFSERAGIHSLGRSVGQSFLPWVVNFCLYFR